LLFLPFIFGASPDEWTKCTRSDLCSNINNECSGSIGDAPQCCTANEQIPGTNNFCCKVGTNFNWQTGVCGTCFDNIKNQLETGVDCGGTCVTSTTEICNGIDDNKKL